MNLQDYQTRRKYIIEQLQKSDDEHSEIVGKKEQLEQNDKFGESGRERHEIMGVGAEQVANYVNNESNQHTITALLFSSQASQTYQSGPKNCPHCHQQFHKSSHMYRHIRQKHQQSREYACTFESCTKTFKRGSHLKRHMISHTHEKKFKCLKCIMEFGYKHHLERHIRIVHEGLGFVCLCGARFAKKRGLAKHVREGCQKGQREDNVDEDTNKQSTLYKHKKIKKIDKYKTKRESQQSQYSQQQSENQRSRQNQNISNQKQKNEQIFHQSDFQYDKNQQKLQKTQKIKQIKKQTSPSKKEKGQKTLYRCPINQCISAYKHKYLLKKHIATKHAKQQKLKSSKNLNIGPDQLPHISQEQINVKKVADVSDECNVS